MKDLFILAGPTAVGKTEISIELAKKLNGEIISCDSMQIYKHMDIGSAKISKEEMDGVPHHLIDFLEPTDSFNVSDFKELATEKINEITARGRLPMVVGGTGLYINSLIFNYEFTDAGNDPEYRAFLENLANAHGKEYVHQMLKEVDPESYERLYPNDLKRVMRALEVHKLTGKTISEFNSNNDIYDIPYNVHYFVLTMDRGKLYDRINRRVDVMLEKGLVDEVKKLRDMGLNADMQSMKGIGYKEILNCLEGKTTYEDAVSLIKKGSRNYAKRQLTWFRKDDRVMWIDKDQFESDRQIVECIAGLVGKGEPEA